MTDHLPVRHEDDLLPLLPAAMAGLGRDGAKAFRDYFTGQIRNANTRAAYARAVARFCAWLDERGLLISPEPSAMFNGIEVAARRSWWARWE